MVAVAPTDVEQVHAGCGDYHIEEMRVSGLLDEKEVTNAKKKECGPASQAHHDSSAHGDIEGDDR